MFLVGFIYRHSGSSVELFQSLDNHLTTLRKKAKIIITSYFSLPGVDWDARCPSSTDSLHAVSVLETMSKLGLIQVVRLSTRIHAASSTMLDLLFLSEGSFILTLIWKQEYPTTKQ